MSTVLEHVPQAVPPPAQPQVHYLNVAFGVRSWLLTTDHKRIALLYLVSVTLMFFIGGAAATLIRLHLMTPNQAPGSGLLTADNYNRMFTMHGLIMIFFFLVPVIPAVLGNFFLPMMIGARDLAFPRLNLLSWYVYVSGAVITFWAMLRGGTDTGWTFYTPFSTKASHSLVVPVLIGLTIAGFSSLFTGLNFVVTVHLMRAPGLTWFRLPLFVWSLYATSVIILLATPVLAMALVLVAVERLWGVGIFDPALGGDPLLFQHLFWFYSHPAVYIMVLPGMGVVSEVITCFARKNIFGYTFVAFASIGIAVLGFLVWAHHMFLAGMSVYASLVFSALSYFVAVPSAIKVFNWTATLYKGSVWLQTPLLFALGFIGLFTIGGMTGLFLAAVGLDVHVHDTYFVVAHFHFIMVGGTVMAYMAGLHYWWPKMSGRMYPEGWGKLAALIVFVGFILTFLPQFVLGYLGMPRRYASYVPEFQVLNVMSSAGASILAVGYVLPLVYLIWSLGYGKKAGPNPWGATGLEWQTPSPPPPENFAVTPVVDRGPYEYASSGEIEVIGGGVPEQAAQAAVQEESHGR
ncbi:MAG TPA: cytochrome c oxidase subunit I [Gemmataceae bacterium]|nr:cytochrome c oxidase subunit I [Gemmataceae bacterium]